MKVYIAITSTNSGDAIERVFLDKEKAEKYVSMASFPWGEPELEIWDTDDDKNFDKITYIDGTIEINPRPGLDEWVGAQLKVTNTLDAKEDLNKVEFHMYPWSHKKLELKLNIKRVIIGEYDEEKTIEKYKKILRELMSKIENLISEGVEEEMIHEWVKQNANEYINKSE